MFVHLYVLHTTHTDTLGNIFILKKKNKKHTKKKKIVYKYEGGPRQRASGASDNMPLYFGFMPPYKTLKRCHLPDLDLTIPACRGITWGRPLSQEEIDHMNAVLGVPA